jgi:hypothetical protein
MKKAASGTAPGAAFDFDYGRILFRVARVLNLSPFDGAIRQHNSGHDKPSDVILGLVPRI